MADGRDEATTLSLRKTFTWTEIFRCFQVALDPRKLVFAALGILVMSLGWWALSHLFRYDKPKEDNTYYESYARQKLGDTHLGPDGKEVAYTEAEYNSEAHRLFERDVDHWKFQNDLAGPGGRMSTLPWDEYRGPNPYLLVTELFGGDAAQRNFALSRFLTGTLPVLIEPLVKMLLPVVKFVDPAASPWTRFFLLLCLVWSLAVWAFFGGIITRIAAIQLAGKDRVSPGEAVRFVARRYWSYILSPLVPLGVISVIVIGLAIFGLIAMIPVFGDLVMYGLLIPLVFLGGLVMAVLLVGLVGYPLMYTTISTEGSDTFDALSRSYNYVFQSPWTYLWYSIVAIAYGAIVTLFVVFMASLTVYLGKWAVSQAPWSEATGRRPDFLFIHAPDSFGWRELFLESTPIAIDPVFPVPAVDAAGLDAPQRVTYVYEDPAAAEQYLSNVWGIENFASWMVSVWLVLAFMLMLGFSYSYFWSAATMIYLLMRKKVDETDLDEIYLEEDLPEAPLSPPTYGAPPSSEKASTSLPTVPPPPPATLPLYTGPATPAVPPVSPPPTVTIPPPPVSPPASPPPPPPVMTEAASTPAESPAKEVAEDESEASEETKPGDSANGTDAKKS